MKTGKTLQQLAQEVSRQAQDRRDFVADTQNLFLTTDGNTTRLFGIGASDPMKTFAPYLTSHAHRQLADRLKVPQGFYDRMRLKHPKEYDHLIEHLLHNEPERRMIRTLDGKARAFMSDRYRRLDNAEILEQVLPVFSDFPELRFESMEITETRLYLKAVYPRIQAEVNVGDLVQAGVMISNSEIGAGSFQIQPLIYRLACKNGMITNAGQKRYHIGKRADEEGELDWSDETKRADDHALLLKTRDTLLAALNEATFGKLVDKLRESTGRKITGNPSETIELLAEKASFNADEKGGVLRHLIEGGDLSQYGLIQAITRTAQDVDSSDRSTELETLGGRILDLPRKDWNELATAA